jgi:tetratricopeptide (TPR) repeat protein
LYKSIDFEDINIPAAFAAMRSFYAENPLGYIKISNTEDEVVRELKISFFQEGFMDSPTPAITIAELQPGETREVPLYAVYNNTILETEGMVPLTGEIILMYYLNDKLGKQTLPVVYDLHDKSALTWDDDQKVAAFITQADNTIKDMDSIIQQATRERGLALFNYPLQAALQVYAALQEIGCQYREDAVSPFSLASENKFAVDSVNLPRETIKRLNGDCDDLTVLFLSLLEARGIETGFITVPGHIYPVFNTGLRSDKYYKIHPDRTMSIIYKGHIWIPVEVTVLGAGDFLQAWYTGVREFKQWEDAPENRKFYVTREAQQLYKPIPLQTDKNGIPDIDKAGIAGGFARDLDKLANLIINDYLKSAIDQPGKYNYDKLGVIYATFDYHQQAETAFRKAMEFDPAYSLPRINLGHLYFKQKKYTEAREVYGQQLDLFDQAGDSGSAIYIRLLLRISSVYYMLEDLDKAREYHARANRLAPELTKQYSELVGDFNKTTRGSKQGVYNLYVNLFEEPEE